MDLLIQRLGFVPIQPLLEIAAKSAQCDVFGIIGRTGRMAFQSEQNRASVKIGKGLGKLMPGKTHQNIAHRGRRSGYLKS